MLWFFSRVIVDISPRSVTHPVSGSWPLQQCGFILAVLKKVKISSVKHKLVKMNCRLKNFFFYGLDSFRCFGVLIMKEVSRHFSFLPFDGQEKQEVMSCFT